MRRKKQKTEGKRKEQKTEERTRKEQKTEIRKSVLIREVPKIGKYDVYGTKDIEEFFKEFEKFCKVKCPENKSHWVKELEECLEGRIFDFL